LTATAAEITAHVIDQDGKPVEDAVLYAEPLDGKADTTPGGVEIMDQINKEFVPHVKPVVVNSQVNFPNKDDIRHHVYSFSEAKEFELPLYEGTPTAPIAFDKPGVIVLGCNIHDWMRGYIVVLETPYYNTSSDDGNISLQLPAGKYRVQLWHPRLKQPDSVQVQEVDLTTSTSQRLDYSLEVKPKLTVRRAPKARSRNRY
jgi:plastocyanin